MADKSYEIKSIVEMKKQHPCGSNTWEVLRVGADIKIKCTVCGRLVMVSKSKFEKNIKKVILEK